MNKKVIKWSLKVLLSILALIVILFIGMNFSPIYNFPPTEPFSGDKIYNPYNSLDTALGWKKSNFHTHTKVDKGINECPEYPDVVWSDYQQYGYDILTFSNHNALTEFPGDTSRQVWVYEHGYNPLKFHKLVFGVKKVNYYEQMLPFTISQKQFMFDLLRKDADLILFNHPDRTFGINDNDFKYLTGYEMVESFCGEETALHYWDVGLSNGHYSHSLINDDCHDSGNTKKIARRCSWLNTPSHSYGDILKTLKEGCFYTMRMPDFGDGDKEIKIIENQTLPAIKNIGLSGDSLYISLSEPAEYIIIVGENGFRRDSLIKTDFANYKFRNDDSYIRLEAGFSSGVVIFTNAFARYQEGKSLFTFQEHSVNIFKTILYNALLTLLIIGVILFTVKKVITRRRS